MVGLVKTVSLAVAGCFFLLCGCTGSVEANRDVVIICDAGEVYQERFYYTDDKESGPYMKMANPSVFTIRNAVRADFSKIIRTVESDTLVLENSAERLFIHYDFNPIESIDFIVNAGDTLLIEKKDGLPYLRVQNRPGSASVNYDREKKLRTATVYGFAPEDLDSFPSVIASLCWNKGVRDLQFVKSEKERIHRLAKASLENESVWMDSLYREGWMDEFEYSFFKERNHYKRLDMELEDLPEEDMAKILAAYSDSLYRNDIFGFYKKYMNALVNKLYFTDYVRHAQGSDLDYPKTFDKINDDALLHGLLKEDNLYVCFRNIADNRSHADGKLYYGKLFESVKDPQILADATRQYGEKFSVTVEVRDDLVLKDSEGNTLMFGELRKSLAGKVLYVDFWASWCAPCKAEMPYSHKLAADYSDEDVVFLYIALNDEEDKWIKAANVLELGKAGKSYLVLNSKDNTWTKQMNITTIPRYMIYGRDGRLVDSNAPRPSSKAIKEELDKLIRK